MKVAFFSNYLNHHQLPFALAMDQLTGGQFVFVATTPVPKSRRSFGYDDMNKAYPFVLTTYDSQENKAAAMQLALEADLVIIGSAPEIYIEQRLLQKKLTFRYSERIYKNGPEWHKYPVRLIRYFWRFGRHKSQYLLCASAFTAADFARTGTFLNKTYKWGYFPEVKTHDVPALMEGKQDEIPRLLWVGRYLPLKHPDDVVLVAERLRQDGYSFSLDFIGSGVMEPQLLQMIEDKGLSDCVHMLGAMKPEEVRTHMEQANIYLFTSDRGEGWGAVLNESMNSGCAVVASHAIGSVPFLMKDQENGLIYRSGDVEMLYEKVKFLLDHPEEQVRLGTAAYQTMKETWNAEVAAERLLTLIDCIQNGTETPYQDGPCSRAGILREDWYTE